MGCCHYDIIGQTLGTVVVQENRAMGTSGESCDLFKPQFSQLWSHGNAHLLK